MKVKQDNEERLIQKIRHQRALDEQLEQFRSNNLTMKESIKRSKAQ